MSDGPHRSLRLQPWWKEFAKRGDQGTYDAEQVAEAAANALASDFTNEVRWELIDALKAVFISHDASSLSTESAFEKLDDAELLAAGSVFGRNAVLASRELIEDHQYGLDNFYRAIGQAAKARGFANVRQVEEHYLRHSNRQRANHVNERLHTAISGFSESHLGSILAASGITKPQRLRKMNNLDDGVPLQ